jgi:serine/threonine protein kinase
MYLHRCRRIHRDIKSDNVLVHSDGSVKVRRRGSSETKRVDARCAQVADFGFCVQLTDDHAARQSVVSVRGDCDVR